jgi:TRAP-type C4-dicarboxylate transport system permease small subunit
MDLYPWLRYIHVAGALLFVLGHGTSVVVSFKVRSERDPQRIQALLQLSASALGIFYVGIVLLLGAGIWAGFTPGVPGSWWGQKWIWVALGAFLLTMFLMYGIASSYYKRLRTIADAMVAGSEAVSEANLAEVLTGPRPWLLAGIGFVSLFFILYLMMFKPF